MDDGNYERQVPEDSAELYVTEDEDMNEETYEPADDDIHAEPYWGGPYLRLQFSLSFRAQK